MRFAVKPRRRNRPRAGQPEYTATPEKFFEVESEHHLNDSFLEQVIMEGLLNESNLSIDVLAGSDSEDDIPLSVLKDIHRSKSIPEIVRHVSYNNGQSNDLEIEAEVLNTEATCHVTDVGGSQTNISRGENRTSIYNTDINNNQSEGLDFESISNSQVDNNGENQTTEFQCPIQRGRKRSRSEEHWKRNIAKRQKNSGMRYNSLSDNTKRKNRVMKTGCSEGCRYKCHKEISENQRENVFHEFWGLGDINRQRDYISSRVHVQPKKMKTYLTDSSRKLSRKWQFKIDGQYVTVCKTFFLHTLDISHTMVDTALRKSELKENRISGVCSPDKRGKHTNRVNKIGAVQISIVKAHINSFPTVDSHYCRKDTNKSYLDKGLSLPKMYELYLEDSQHHGFAPVSIYTY